MKDPVYMKKTIALRYTTYLFNINSGSLCTYMYYKTSTNM